jgi:hypothetical protein
MPSIGFEMRPKNSKSALRLHAGRPGSPHPELLARTIEFCGGTVNYTFVPPRGHEAAMPRNGPRGRAGTKIFDLCAREEKVRVDSDDTVLRMACPQPSIGYLQRRGRPCASISKSRNK